MKILNYGASKVVDNPEDISYGNVSGEHLLSKAKCLNILNNNESVLFYAEKAVCKKYGRGLSDTFLGVSVYPYIFYLYVDSVKFPDLLPYLNTDVIAKKKLILFNRNFSGNIVEVATTTVENEHHFIIGVKVYSPDVLPTDVCNLTLSDNSFIIVDYDKSKVIMGNMFASSITEKLEVARFGSFGRIYNSDLQINVEFPPIRKSFDDGAELESDLIMSKLLFLDLNIYRLSELKIVNEPTFSEISRTINTKEIRNAKMFYIMNMTQSIVSENNSYKINVKASLI